MSALNSSRFLYILAWKLFEGVRGLVKYWIFAVSEENWFVIKEKYVYGVPEGSKAVDLVKPGDVAVFYVKKKGSKELGGKFVGAFSIISNWYHELKPLWPDEVRESRVKYPWRIRIKPIKFGAADFTELVPRLSFVTNKERPYVFLIGIPANLGKPVPEKDAKLIIESLR